MKKIAILKLCLKVIMIILMILGIAFSVYNFLPIEINAAVGNDGHQVILPDGTLECYAPGDGCVVGNIGPKLRI